MIFQLFALNCNKFAINYYICNLDRKQHKVTIYEGNKNCFKKVLKLLCNFARLPKLIEHPFRARVWAHKRTYSSFNLSWTCIREYIHLDRHFDRSLRTREGLCSWSHLVHIVSGVIWQSLMEKVTWGIITRWRICTHQTCILSLTYTYQGCIKTPKTLRFWLSDHMRHIQLPFSADLSAGQEHWGREAAGVNYSLQPQPCSLSRLSARPIPVPLCSVIQHSQAGM